MTRTDPTLRVLAERLRGSRALVLTGAGLSTDSGIPDYRGPDGTRRVMPMQYGEFAGSGDARRRYWARSYAGWQRFRAAGPNAGHHAVTRLQELGAVGAVITQNVDGLHTQAGTREVLELHGALREVICLDCGDRRERGAVQAELAQANPGFLEQVRAIDPAGSRVSSQIRPDGDIELDAAAAAGFRAPVCRRCGLDRVKPDVVFFGENVPRARVERCFELTDAAALMLVLGSSLAVMSGLRFVRRASRTQIPVAAITRGWTRGDDLLTWKLDAPLSETLSALVSLIAADAA